MRGLFYLLCSTILISGCKTAGEYLNRPKVVECLTLSQPGKMACNGKVLDIPAGLTIAPDQERYEKIRSHYIKSEQYEYECRKFKNCPRGRR